MTPDTPLPCANKIAFVKMIAQAIFNGRAKTQYPISKSEALERAEQVAAALPQLGQDIEQANQDIADVASRITALERMRGK